MTFRPQIDACDSAPALGAKTVLVVDDYRSLGEIVASMLRPKGYRVLIASSGAEAKQLATHFGPIDLLLTDVEMPGIRGDELAAWFRSVNGETRVLFMSGQREASLAPLLQKPFRTEVLLCKVHDVLHRDPVATVTETPNGH